MSTALLNERGKTHGDCRVQFDNAQRIKDALFNYTGYDFTAYLGGRIMRESLEQIATKLSRIVTGDPMHVDHWRDIAGYATLIAEMLEGKKQCAQ